MIVNPSYFRKKGKDALKGDFQTPLLVSFFSGFLLTAASLLSSLITARLSSGMSDLLQSIATSAAQSNSVELNRFLLKAWMQLRTNLGHVPDALWIALAGCVLVGLITLPAFRVSESSYYLRRHQQQKPSVWSGLFGSFPIFFKCLGLYALLALKIFLWALICIPVIVLIVYASQYIGALSLISGVLVSVSLIPAIRAYLRYRFAPFFLAEKPERGISECIRLSKAATDNRAVAVFGVMIIFLFYSLLTELLLELISGLGASQAVIIVLELALGLLISVYGMTTITALFNVMAHPEEEKAMHDILRRLMRERGMDENMIEQMIRGKRGESREKKKGEAPIPGENNPSPDSEDDDDTLLN